jgi:flavin-dependent dehydrogenase
MGHLYVLETEERSTDTAVARGLVDFDLSVLRDGLQGYYWDFPTLIGGVRHVSRGIYHANVTPSSDVKRALARALAKRDVDIAKVKLKPFSTRPFVAESTTWLDGVVLVGEAAGIDRTTGEGIAQAIVMGALAARHLARALCSRGSSFEGYDRDVRDSTIGRHMLQSAWLARRVYGRTGSPARRLLVRSPDARRHAVKWYCGERLSLFTEMRLAAGLLTSAMG